MFIFCGNTCISPSNMSVGPVRLGSIRVVRLWYCKPSVGLNRECGGKLAFHVRRLRLANVAQPPGMTVWLRPGHQSDGRTMLHLVSLGYTLLYRSCSSLRITIDQWCRCHGRSATHDSRVSTELLAIWLANSSETGIPPFPVAMAPWLSCSYVLGCLPGLLTSCVGAC